MHRECAAGRNAHQQKGKVDRHVDIHRASGPPHTAAPQSWVATVTDAKFHWYDLIAGFPERPDIHDPIGRYQRRMQFELEAVAERHHLFYAVTRPRVRFDANGSISWAFFSLKLTLPLLMGLDEIKETLTFEPTVPFAATLKKPIVTLTPNFFHNNSSTTPAVTPPPFMEILENE